MAVGSDLLMLGIGLVMGYLLALKLHAPVQFKSFVDGLDKLTGKKKKGKEDVVQKPLNEWPLMKEKKEDKK